MKKYMYIAIGVLAVLVFLVFQMRGMAGLEVSAEDVKGMIDSKEKFTLVDVREVYEWNESHIKQATLVPLGSIATQFEKKFPKVKKDDKIILHCRSGVRSMRAVKMLQQMGYTNAYSMRGGILAWTRAGYPVKK